MAQLLLVVGVIEGGEVGYWMEAFLIAHLSTRICVYTQHCLL